jgi:hypothetical protein
MEAGGRELELRAAWDAQHRRHISDDCKEQVRILPTPFSPHRLPKGDDTRVDGAVINTRIAGAGLSKTLMSLNHAGSLEPMAWSF